MLNRHPVGQPHVPSINVPRPIPHLMQHVAELRAAITTTPNLSAPTAELLNRALDQVVADLSTPAAPAPRPEPIADATTTEPSPRDGLPH